MEQKISYYYSLQSLADAFINRNYKGLQHQIEIGKVTCTESIHEDGSVYGYHVHDNVPLTKLYGFPVYMVDFVFSNVERLHASEQHEKICEIMRALKEKILSMPGYYILRMPTHIVDAMQAFSICFERFFFCGGLVSYLSNPKDVIAGEKHSDIEVVLADNSLLAANEKELKAIAQKAFGEYQGQYHLSPVTAAKAADIYVDWIDKSFASGAGSETMFIAFCDGALAGFWSFEEGDYSQMGLTGTSPKYRGRGVYEAMLTASLRLNPKMIIGTQFDNYIVQNTWIHHHLHPFNSIYSLHVDAR